MKSDIFPIKCACCEINQSISLIYLRFILFPSASDLLKLQWLSAAHNVIICEHVFAAWKFFSVAEEDKAIAICNACSARIPRGGKNVSSFNPTNQISHLKGRHRDKDVLRDFKQPPLLEW